MLRPGLGQELGQELSSQAFLMSAQDEGLIRWAFLITHNRPLGRADWAFVLGWGQKGLNALMSMPSGLGLHPGLASKSLNVSMGMPLLWGLASGPASPFFKPYQ